jgi:hypothetical protein
VQPPYKWLIHVQLMMLAPKKEGDSLKTMVYYDSFGNQKDCCVPDDFFAGDCLTCPFSKGMLDESGNDMLWCRLGYNSNNCKLEEK